MISRTRILLLVLLLLHGVGVAALFPPTALLSSEPLFTDDYPLHYYRAVHAVSFMKQHGQPWGYDPFLMAGYPIGTVFDMDNKGTEYFLLATSWILGSVASFNLFVWLSFMVVPLGIFAASRKFGLSDSSSLLAACLALAFWYLDFGVRTYITLGAFSYGAMSCLAPLMISMHFRWSAKQETKPAVSALVLTPFLFTIHVLGAVVTATGYVASLLVGWRRNGTRAIRDTALLGFLVVLINLPWLIPLLRFWDYKTDTGGQYFASGGAAGLLAQFSQPGVAVRSVVLLLGLLGLYRLVRSGMGQAAFVLVASCLPLGIAGYLGSSLPFIETLEPSRFLLPFHFFLCIPGALSLGFLAKKIRDILPGRLDLVVWALVLLLGLLIFNSNIRVVAFHNKILVGNIPEGKLLVDWINNKAPTEGRILLEDAGTYSSAEPYRQTHLPAILPLYTGREFVGGPQPQAYILHHYVDFSDGKLLGKPLAGYSDLELDEVLRVYNISSVIVWSQKAVDYFEHSSRVESMGASGPFRFYHALREPTYMLEGSGAVHAEMNRIRVENASAGSVLLAYHWLESLACEPQLPIKREFLGDDPIGFLRVENGSVTDFTIYNTYY